MRKLPYTFIESLGQLSLGPIVTRACSPAVNINPWPSSWEGPFSVSRFTPPSPVGRFTQAKGRVVTLDVLRLCGHLLQGCLPGNLPR
jgi:hypothetical protein